MDQPSSTESNALTLRIRFKSTSLDEFIGRYAVDVSPGGIFIRTKQPVEVGTPLQFDFMLADGSSLLAGLGTVAWVRENDPARANNVPGMGLRFDKLTPDSQQTHQKILAEKARREGKPQGTPYPPTAFVVPASRPAESAVPEGEPTRPGAMSPALPDTLGKQESSPANFAKTLPAPAAALAARVSESFTADDDFDSAGKTEISSKPIEEIMREAELAQRQAQAAAEFAPGVPLEDTKTDAHELEEGGAPPSPEEVAVTDSQAYATEVPVPPPSASSSGERRLSSKESFAALLDLGDTGESPSAEDAAPLELPIETSSGVPEEFSASSDKTEEVSLAIGKATEEVLMASDVGMSTGPEDSEPVPTLEEVDAATLSRKGKPEGKRGIGVAIAVVLLAGAAAFAAVYLLQTKPWELPAGVGEQPVVAKVNPAPTPAPAPKVEPEEQPAAAHAPKPAAAEAPSAKKAAPTEDKAAAKPAVEPVVAVAEKPAAKPEPKRPVEKPAVEAKSAPVAARPVHAKPSSRSASRSSSKPAAESAAASEEPADATASKEEIYRLSIKSSPIGAEVLLDGEYYARTPCDRRVLDPKKPIAITVRKAGYESHERLIGSSANWVKRTGERVLTVSVTLKRAAKPAATEKAAPVKEEGEEKAEPKPAAAPPKPAAEPEEEPHKE